MRVRVAVWGVIGAACLAWGGDVPGVRLERSYWVHASLGLLVQRGYYGAGFPEAEPPGREEVANAARLLCGRYGANRLYLIYHREIADGDARRAFAWWRAACPASVELVPALPLRMYDQPQTPVFTPEEAGELADFFQASVNARRLAVYDVYAGRDQGELLPLLAKRYPVGLIRVGLQPGEALDPRYERAVQDTWSGFCHGTRTAEDWAQPGFGADALRRWAAQRNAESRPIVWDLVVVAWDYTATPRGAYPGYDDAAKNRPLPAGRNRAGAEVIAAAAKPGVFGGFSSGLFILHENSRHAAHDGTAAAFYQTLRQGKAYSGYYAEPFGEVAAIYRELASGTFGVEPAQPPGKRP
jgi:hypothetical protein